MGQKKTYMITHDFSTPYVRSSRNPRNPTEIMRKTFRRGEMIVGELIKDGNKPNFVLFNKVCVVPLSVVREVVTKEIISSADGKEPRVEPLVNETTRKVIETKNPKVKYMDAILVGAIVGLAGVFLANKKQWIKTPNNINYAYGAGAGAVLAWYFVYRNNNKPKAKAV